MKLNPLRGAKTLYSLGVLVRDPSRLGQVFEMADALSTPSLLEPMADALCLDPGCARAFVDKPRLRVDLVELRTLPRGTLGREYAEHMTANGLDPASIPTLPSTDRLSFLRAHLYETHDVWHVVAGFGTTWQGEIGLQAFYLAQIPGPLSAMLLAVGALRIGIYDMGSRDAVMNEVVRGWTMGKRAKPLFGVRWDEHWSTDLALVRERLDISVASPTVDASTSQQSHARAA